MYTLRCDNLNMTIKSLAKAFHVSGADIRQAFCEIREYDVERELITHSNFVRNEAIRLIGTPCAPHSVRWFHFSAAFKLNTYDEGLKPIEGALEQTVKDIALRIPHEHRQKFLRIPFPERLPENVRCRFQQPPAEKGPFAMLIKETARHCRSLGHVNYLEMSELTRGICEAATEVLGINIRNIISKKLRPLVVCFESSRDAGVESVFTAFHYAYVKQKTNRIDGDSVGVFRANGEDVPISDIRYVKEYRPYIV